MRGPLAVLTVAGLATVVAWSPASAQGAKSQGQAVQKQSTGASQ